MPDLTTSSAVDTFMQAADATAMRTALGITDPCVILSVKNLTVLTSGAPADIGSISVPSWLTRYVIVGGTTIALLSRMIAETAAGTLAGAAFNFRSAASGAGTALTNVLSAGPTAAATGVPISCSSVSTLPFTSASTIYINQTTNSANAGTVSVYLMLVPLL